MDDGEMASVMRGIFWFIVFILFVGYLNSRGIY
jgi:hypothetical protein